MIKDETAMEKGDARRMNKYILSICNRDADAEIIEEKEDEMETVIRCPYCGAVTTVGQTIMFSGFVGCDNCFWGENGLMKTVLDIRKNSYEEYLSGEFYRKGYQGKIR